MPFLSSTSNRVVQSLVPVLNSNTRTILGLFWLPAFLPATSQATLQVSTYPTTLTLPSQYYVRSYESTQPALLVVFADSLEQCRGRNNFFQDTLFPNMFDSGPSHVYGQNQLTPTSSKSLIDKLFAGNVVSMQFTPTTLPPDNSDDFTDAITISGLFDYPFVDLSETQTSPTSTTTSSTSTFEGVIAPQYTHVQTNPATEWLVEHNLTGGLPMVAVYTAGGVNLTSLASATYQNASTVLLSFPEPIAGVAFFITQKI